MRVAQAGEDLRHRAADGLALEGAGPGDEQQPTRVEEHGGTGAPGTYFRFRRAPRRRCSRSAAPMKAAKSG